MENNLDKYFKEKLDQRQFDMKDAYWQQAQDLLDADERRRRRRGWLWWGGGAAALLAIVVAYFVFSNDGAYAGIIANENTLSPQNIELEKENDSVNNNQNVESENKIDELNNDLIENIEPVESVKKEGVILGNKTPEKSVRNSNDIAIINEENSVIDLTDNNAKKGLLFNEVIVENSAKIQRPSINELDEGIAIENEVEINILPQEEIIEKIEKRVLLAAPDELTLLQILVISDGEEEGLKVAEKKLDSNWNPWSIGFTAAQLFQSTPQSDEQAVIALKAGVLLRYDLGEKSDFYLQSGLLYQRRSGTFERSKITETKNYRFGLELDTNMLRPSSMHTVLLPILVGWERGRHVLEAGISMNYLTGVQGERGGIERVPDSNPPRRDFVPIESGWISEYGFKKLTATGQFNYRFRVNTQWSFGLSANYTFGGILENIGQGVVGASGVQLKEDDKLYFGLQAVYFLK